MLSFSLFSCGKRMMENYLKTFGSPPSNCPVVCCWRSKLSHVRPRREECSLSLVNGFKLPKFALSLSLRSHIHSRSGNSTVAEFCVITEQTVVCTRLLPRPVFTGSENGGGREDKASATENQSFTAGLHSLPTNNLS